MAPGESEGEKQKLNPIIELLGPEHDRSGFCSGIAELDTYLHRQAGQDQKRRIAATYLMVSEGNGAILGYFTLSGESISRGDMPPESLKKLPRYDRFPAILLGRLAVDSRYQGMGLGALLLIRALQHALRLTRNIGAIVVIVDAIDERACRFYLKYGFVQFPDRPHRLFLPMAVIERLDRESEDPHP